MIRIWLALKYLEALRKMGDTFGYHVVQKELTETKAFIEGKLYK